MRFFDGKRCAGDASGCGGLLFLSRPLVGFMKARG